MKLSVYSEAQRQCNKKHKVMTDCIQHWTITQYSSTVYIGIAMGGSVL